MEKVVPNARPRRAFLRLNLALSMCAIGLASLAMASKAKEALAYGPEDGVCANIVGDNNCPEGTTFVGYYEPDDSTTCHASAPYYGPGGSGPYYNCCTYQTRSKMCSDDFDNNVSFAYAEYYRSTSIASTCLPATEFGPAHCQLTAGN